MGLGISNEALSTKIAGDETFQDPSGNFDRNRFVQLLQNAGLSEDQYVQELRTGYTRQQIVDGLAGETGIPEAFMRGLHEYQNEERNLSWVVLDPAGAGVIPEPDRDRPHHLFRGPQERLARARVPRRHA